MFLVGKFCRSSYIPDVSADNEKRWVDVLFPRPPLRPFTYEVPERFRRDLCLGHRVVTPLGRRKMVGFVVDFVERPTVSDLREVEDVLDPYPLLTPELLRLTRWVADYYLCSWGEVVRAALPPGVHREDQLVVRRMEDAVGSDEPLTDVEEGVLGLVEEKGKGVSLRTLERRFGKKGIRFGLGRLERMGMVRVEPVLTDPEVRVRAEWWVSLREEIDSEEIQRLRERAPRQARVLSALVDWGGEARRCDFEVDFGVLRTLERKGWVDLWEEEVVRDYYGHVAVEKPSPVTLTQEQKNALSQMDDALGKGLFRVFLLHGVTASGKTQVYIEAIRRVLDQGKTALVLIPEIALTPQAVQRYRGHFGDGVAVLHSRMSRGERYDAWRKLRDGTYRIGLGPRSAVFAPLENLGLIVVDEEHEASYKQTDPAPRYHARDVAIVRGQLNGCGVILGSATPSLESYFNCRKGKYVLCELTHRIDQVPMPSVSLVNTNEIVTDEESRILSPLLRQKMAERLDRGEQVILLQNRRGYATFLRCGACGMVARCPRCDITLTYHQRNRRLRCHYCGFQRGAPGVCPECSGATLGYRGVGTERVEEEVRRFFPGVRVSRMDSDTTRRKGAHDKIVRGFEEGRGDVLLGTQMVAKGHDFPGVTLVGIVSADTGLHFPDFRSGERTFQLLTQASGRAGRRTVSGEVVIQTLSPDDPALRFAAAQDVVGYYEWEMGQRESLGYPPWGRIVVVRFKGVEEVVVAEAARRFVALIERDGSSEILGPVPSPLSRIRGMYRYQVIFRERKDQDPSGRNLRERVRKGLTRFWEQTRFASVRVAMDVDPADMM